MGLPIRTAAFGIAMIMAGQALAQGAADPTGTWLTEDGRAKIRLEHCGENTVAVCGFVVWMKDPLNDKGQPRTDIKNPDPAKRSRPSLGLKLIEELKPDEDNKYAGEIYNADDGKKYSVTIAVENPKELKVRGCLLRFLCGSQAWARVADIAVPGAATAASTKVVSSTAKPVKAAVQPGKPHDQQAPAQQ